MTLRSVLGSLVVSVPALILVGFTIFDAVRRRDLTAWRKALWLALVVVVPVLGTFLYLLARPFPDPITQGIDGNARTAEFVDLLERRERGDLHEDELRLQTQRLFGA